MDHNGRLFRLQLGFRDFMAGFMTDGFLRLQDSLSFHGDREDPEPWLPKDLITRIHYKGLGFRVWGLGF